MQISDKVLLRILRHPDVIQEIKFNDSDKRCPQHFVYQRGKAVDYFILILQERGREGGGEREEERGRRREGGRRRKGEEERGGGREWERGRRREGEEESGIEGGERGRRREGRGREWERGRRGEGGGKREGRGGESEGEREEERGRHHACHAGRVEVEAGNENMKFETGPFSYYGSHIGGLNRTASLGTADRTESVSVSGSSSQINTQFAVPSPSYTPDFYVRALTDLQFVKITRAQYQNGLMASRLDSAPQSPDCGHPRLEGTTPPVGTATLGFLADDTPTPEKSPLLDDETTSLLNEQYGPLLDDETTSLLKEQNSLPHNHHNQSESSI
ncbi:unnamed protein product [Coregonus sp. 'balchen']|nr:unnamed protein product [Coregonus sp. 'balchen']